jgi:two-component system, chemotaxis family, protein-glutamate methylesterase/glutaminase
MAPVVRPIRLAIVDDSSFVRKALQRVLEDDPRLLIVGAAGTGEELLDKLSEWRPEVVTLDLSMPGLGGLATLDRLMATAPLPVIILSTHSAKDAPLTIEALHHGAVDFIDKQEYSLVDFERLREVLLEKILAASSVMAASRSAGVDSISAMATIEPGSAPHSVAAAPGPGQFEIALIGASTGGPPAIQTVLEDIGATVPVPIAVVQHMPIGFTRAFAERLNAHLPLTVVEAGNGDRLEPGTVYVAPAGQHLSFRRTRAGVMTALSSHPKDHSHCPSVTVLFESAATVFGKRVVAVLLTGMGDDGATGMLALREAGAYTIAQDQASSVVYGMPAVARRLGAVRQELALSAIGRRVNDLLVADR